VLLLAGTTEIAARAPADIKLRLGETVPFSILEHQLHFFRASDGRRIARPS
jgi:hypothetical protein